MPSPKRHPLSSRIASSLWSGCALGGLALLTPFAAQADCDNPAPATGQTTTCDATAPNPDTQPVVAAVGSTDVRVDVLAGAGINVVNASGVTLRDQSQVTNAGSISVTAGAGFDGITATGLGNTITNSAGGTIFSQAGSGIEMQAGGTVINDGAITAQTGTGVLFGGTADSVLVNRGTISGAAAGVSFGDGNDRFEMRGGSVTGAVSQGDGDDVLLMTGGTLVSVNQGSGVDTGESNRFEISGGTVTGLVHQGNGANVYVMTGGQVGSLSQGDQQDTFTMSAGRIVGAFEDGDIAHMSGGRIGRVDMKLDDNRFDMSGGSIDGNLVAGFGNDTILLSNGFIGGNISVSGGQDKVTVTGGTVGGEVRVSAGNDVFTWDGGGIIHGMVDLGIGNDAAALRNLTAANMGITPLVTGGLGVDGLVFDNVTSAGVPRFQNWETIAATNNTELTFESSLTLGDSATGTGSLTVDATSTLFGGGTHSSILPFTAGQFVNVRNAGRIDLTNGVASTTDTFTIVGNYAGNGGTLLLHTQLGDDSSPSDRLAISGGTASGSTGIGIVNLGGAGAATLQDGIMVVQALGGAATASAAFALNGAVAAGAFEYVLFKGGVSGGTAENWYLRSTLAPPPSPGQPGPMPSPPIAGPDPFMPLPSPSTPPPTPGATAATGAVIPLYRIEAPTYAVVPPAIHPLGLATLGTFHERQGEQSLLQGAGALPAAWARVIGQDTRQSWSGTVDPTFDGTLWGMQVGADLFARESDAGHRDHVGLFIGRTRMDGDVRGFALGWNNLTVGKVEFDDAHLGAYWTHIAPGGAYLDGVILGSRIDGDAASARAVGVDIDGDGLMLSLEGGYPFALGESWILEPQAQVIWQQLSFDGQHDRFSTIEFDADDAVTARVGLRLAGNDEAARLHPYLKANYWHGFSGTDSVLFGTNLVDSEQKFDAFEFGGGLVARYSDRISFHLTGDYTVNAGGERRRSFEGNLGMRVNW